MHNYLSWGEEEGMGKATERPDPRVPFTHYRLGAGGAQVT